MITSILKYKEDHKRTYVHFSVRLSIVLIRILIRNINFYAKYAQIFIEFCTLRSKNSLKMYKNFIKFELNTKLKK